MKHKYCDDCHKELALNEEYYQSSCDHICKACYEKKFPTETDKLLVYYFGNSNPSREQVRNFINGIRATYTQNKDVEQFMEDYSIKNGGYYMTIREDEEDYDEED